MRVVHVLSSLSVGGMERFVLRLAREQRRVGHTVKVIALRGGPLFSELAPSDADVFVARGGRVERFVSVMRTILAAAPHVIHAHNPTCLHYAVPGKLATRARLLMTDHAQGHGLPRMPTAFERRCVDAIAAVSRHTAAHPIAPDFRDKTVVIHNGVECASVQPDRDNRRRLAGVASRFVGVMPASLKPIKGHRVLLESIAILKQRNIPVTMLLAGEGPEDAALRRRASELALTDQDVQFLGFRADIPALLDLADFMVLPSLSEGLPLSILEAMSQGTPVVASAVGGIPEVITDAVNGLLVPPSDPDRLAGAIGTLFENPDLRRRVVAEARRTAESDFSFDTMRQRYEGLYLRLVGRR